jgi:hypothetical protein
MSALLLLIALPFLFLQQMVGLVASCSGKIKKACAETWGGKCKFITLVTFGTAHLAKESTTELLEFPGHGLKNNNMIFFETLSAESSKGLEKEVIYYVIKEATNNFGLAEEKEGTPIKWSGALEGKYRQVTELAQVEHRIPLTLEDLNDRIYEDKGAGRAIKLTGACTVNGTAMSEVETGGELHTFWQSTEEVISAAATVTASASSVTVK